MTAIIGGRCTAWLDRAGHPVQADHPDPKLDRSVSHQAAFAYSVMPFSSYV